MRRRELLQFGLALAGLGMAGCLQGEECPDEARITVDDPPEDPPGAPTADPCATLQGVRFRSVGRHDDSFTGPDEPGVYHTVRFDDGEFVYTQTDTGFDDTVTCNPSDCLAEVTGHGPDGPEFYGTYDPVTQLLRWDGTLFRLQRSTD